MNQLRLVGLVTALVLAAPGGTAAQTAPAPKPDFSSLAFFNGNWTCTRTKSPNPKRVGSTYRFMAALDPSGYWQTYRVVEGDVATDGHLTYDATAKAWTFLYVSSTGDYGVATSPGWTGTTMVYKDVLNGGGAPLGSSTFTKTSDTALTREYAVTTPTGTLTYTSSCVKS